MTQPHDDAFCLFPPFFFLLLGGTATKDQLPLLPSSLLIYRHSAFDRHCTCTNELRCRQVWISTLPFPPRNLTALVLLVQWLSKTEPPLLPTCRLSHLPLALLRTRPRPPFGKMKCNPGICKGDMWLTNELGWESLSLGWTRTSSRASSYRLPERQSTSRSSATRTLGKLCRPAFEFGSSCAQRHDGAFTASIAEKPHAPYYQGPSQLT